MRAVWSGRDAALTLFHQHWERLERGGKERAREKREWTLYSRWRSILRHGRSKLHPAEDYVDVDERKKTINYGKMEVPRVEHSISSPTSPCEDMIKNLSLEAIQLCDREGKSRWTRAALHCHGLCALWLTGVSIICRCFYGIPMRVRWKGKHQAYPTLQLCLTNSLLDA